MTQTNNTKSALPNRGSIKKHSSMDRKKYLLRKTKPKAEFYEKRGR